jgi:hypothetical protein
MSAQQSTATPPQDRLAVVDLSDLNPNEIQTLRMEAMQRGLSMSQLLSEMVLEVTRRQQNQTSAA